MTPERRSALTCTADPTVVRNLADTSDVFVMALLDSSPDCIKLIELDGSLSYMNPNGQCAMEIDDFTLVAGAPWETLWPEKSRRDIANTVAAAMRGETSRVEAFCPTAKGRARWWDVSVSPVMGSDGKIARILSVSRDITPIIEREDRLRAYDAQLKALNTELSDQLERADILMREVDHRVKNSLAMIAGILRVQSRRVDDDASRDTLREAAGRVATVGRVHERLQLSGDLKRVDLDQYLPAITDDVSAALSRDDIGVCADVAPLATDSDRAVALGLIASELLTNAIKHAFEDGAQDCEVKLELKRSGEGRARLVVSDNGRGGCAAFGTLPDGRIPTGKSANATTSGGLGSRIISLYSEKLGGTLECHSPEGVGTVMTFEFEI